MYIGRIPTSVPLSANDVPDLPASKITSGQFSNSLISASSVSQHATSFDDNKIVNDLSTLGLRVHTQENLNVSSTNSTIKCPIVFWTSCIIEVLFSSIM